MLIVTVLLLWLIYYQSLCIAQKYDLVCITVVGEPLHGLEVRLGMWRQWESLCTAQKYDLACRGGGRRAFIRPRSTTQHVAVVVGELLHGLEVRPGILQQYKSLCTAWKYDLACGGSGRASTEPLYGLEVRPGMLQQQESLYTAQKYDLAYSGSRRASIRPGSTTQHVVVVVGELLYGLEVRLSILQQQQESFYTAQKYDLTYYSSTRASARPRSTTQHMAVVGEPLQSLYTAQKYDLAYCSSRRASVRPKSTTQYIVVAGEPLQSLCTAQKYDLAYCSSRRASVQPGSTTWYVVVVGEPLHSLEV